MERHHRKGHNDLPWDDFDRRDKPCRDKCAVIEKCEVKRCEKPKKCEVVCKPKCEPVCKPKKCEEKKKCHKKKRCSSSSSSSSSDCDRPAVPKITYTACTGGGVISLGISVVATTPNGTGITTYTCPSQIGQKIYLNWTITNTGNTSVKTPIYLYNSGSGVSRVTCKRLAAGASVTTTTHFKITRCNCITGGVIPIVANAYTYVHGNCLILVSQPLGLTFTQTS